MAGRLKGKVAVITGATSGIGEATARHFIKEGAEVMLSGRNADKGLELAAELGANATFHAADVMREAEVGALMDAATARFGRVDCMFNNAGGVSLGTIETVTEDDFNYSMQLLVGSVVYGIKHAARVMKPNGGGNIINNSSIAAHRVSQGGYLYAAAKAAVSHITRLAGSELGPVGIRVNAISPGAVATPIFWGGSDKARTLSDEENLRKKTKMEGKLKYATPLHKNGYVDDVAMAAVYLASDEARFINSHDLVVDGGRIWQFFERPDSGLSNAPLR